MQAFPEGSANMALGGAGPLHSRLDLDRFHGRGEEGFQDYGNTRKADTAQLINPHDRTEMVHGEESYGLGTSTFLEGAPASKNALQRRESEEQTTTQEESFGGAGGPARAVYTKENEVNPFDNEYDAAFEKKGTQIKIAEQEKPNIGRARAPSSPRGPSLTRSMTADAAVRTSGEEEKPSGGGFLHRMKSLKGGGRRARPERKDSNV